MALEQATFINQLVTSNPQSTDTVAQADDHIRMIKAVLKTTFPNITGAVTATQDDLNTVIPTGLIAMWSGAINAIPSGWALCNGSNGTPDLRDRFVVGAGSTYAVGNTGGANSVTLTESQIPAHTHVITTSGSAATAGAHTHTLTDPGHAHSDVRYQSLLGGLSGGGSGWAGTTNVNTASATTGITMASAGDHTHVITVTATAASTGGGQSHENRPPYFALAYIMKV